jgi:hypothetical protein
VTLATLDVQTRRDEFVRRARTWEDVVAIPGFLIFGAAAFVAMWLTRQQPGMKPILLPMILFGAAISCILVLLPRAVRKTQAQLAGLAREVGLHCPECARPFVSVRGEITLRRGQCECGAQVLQSETPEWRASLPTLAQLRRKAWNYNWGTLAIFCIWGASVIGAMMLLETPSLRGSTPKLLLAIAVVAIWGVVYWGWTRLHLWCGAACPACGEELVGGKGEPAAGIAERTKSCPRCGASVVS